MKSRRNPHRIHYLLSTRSTPTLSSELGIPAKDADKYIDLFHSYRQEGMTEAETSPLWLGFVLMYGNLPATAFRWRLTLYLANNGHNG